MSSDLYPGKPTTMLLRALNVKTLLGTHKKNGVPTGRNEDYYLSRKKKQESMKDGSSSSNNFSERSIGGGGGGGGGGAEDGEDHVVIGTTSTSGSVRYLMGDESQTSTGTSTSELYGMFESARSHSQRLDSSSLSPSLHSIAEKTSSRRSSVNIASKASMKKLLMSCNKKIFKKVAELCSASNEHKLQLKVNVTPTFKDCVVKYQGELYIPHMMGPSSEIVMIGINKGEPQKASFFYLSDEVLKDLEPCGEIKDYIVVGIKHGKLLILPWNDTTSSGIAVSEVPLLKKSMQEMVENAQQNPSSKQPTKDSFKFVITNNHNK